MRNINEQQIYTQHTSFYYGWFKIWRYLYRRNKRINYIQRTKELKVNFQASKHDKDLHTFVCNMKTFSKAVQTLDDKKEYQNSLPIHDFVEACKK